MRKKNYHLIKHAKLETMKTDVQYVGYRWLRRVSVGSYISRQSLRYSEFRQFLFRQPLRQTLRYSHSCRHTV